MNKLSEVVNNYKRKENKRKTKKEALEKQIEDLKIELEKVENSYVSWVDGILVPLGKEIMKRKGFKFYETYGPFGWNCECSIYFANERRGKGRTRGESDIDICHVDTYSLTFRPNMTYRTGKQMKLYPENSIAALNGDNDIFEKLPEDIDDIIKLLHFSKGRNDD